MEAVTPEIDGGRFPAKRVVGETVVVEGDIFTDGQDALAAVLRYRHEAATRWIETPMAPLVNDRWRGEFPVTELGRYVFTIEAWWDHFETWGRQLAKRVAAGQGGSPGPAGWGRGRGERAAPAPPPGPRCPRAWGQPPAVRAPPP